VRYLLEMPERGQRCMGEMSPESRSSRSFYAHNTNATITITSNDTHMHIWYTLNEFGAITRHKRHWLRTVNGCDAPGGISWFHLEIIKQKSLPQN